MRNLAIKYIKEKSNDWFVLLGQSGAGKTMICSAICNELLNQGKEVIYQSWNTFVSEYKHELRNSDGNKMIEKLQVAEIVYIDDFLREVKQNLTLKT